MAPLTTYLVAIMFHEADAFTAWNRGVIKDYESTTGIFVEAASREEAVAWGESIGQALLRHVNDDDAFDWASFGYSAWTEESPESGGWKHCLSFFQRVLSGTMPDLPRMTSAAYEDWAARNGV